MNKNSEWINWTCNELNDTVVNRILQVCPIRKVMKGDSIYRQGEHRDAIYLILEGRVEISAGSAEGRKKVFCIREPRCFIGTSLLVEGSSLTNALCLTSVSVAVIKMQDIFKFDKEILLLLLMNLSQVVKQLTTQLNGQTFDDIGNRVENLLFSLSNTFGEVQAKGVSVNIPLSHQLIAEMVGSSRVRISQVIGEMTKNGKLDMNRSHFMLKNNQ